MGILPEFIYKDIHDRFIRENWKRLNLFLQEVTILKGQFEFFELTFDAAVTNDRVGHGLGFEPLDVIQTSITGAGAITFNYSLFDGEFIDVTTTGACVVRCFIGRYEEESKGKSV
jgi:hypothetical protein